MLSPRYQWEAKSAMTSGTRTKSAPLPGVANVLASSDTVDDVEDSFDEMQTQTVPDSPVEIQIQQSTTILNSMTNLRPEPPPNPQTIEAAKRLPLPHNDCVAKRPLIFMLSSTCLLGTGLIAGYAIGSSMQ